MGQQVFYTPSNENSGPIIIDFVKENGRSEVMDHDLETLRIRYPGTEIGDYEKIAAMSRAAFILGPEKITERQFFEMLEVLPPVSWVNHGDTESFKMAERTYADITGIYCRIGEKYFYMSDSITTSHEFIVDKCRRKHNV